MMLDSDFVIHVSKSGNDVNSGKAGQYPVNLANDSKLTIGSALSAVPDGGMIVIWPGTYSEQVDITTAAKQITLIGTHRYKCIITQASGITVIPNKGCVFKNLTIINTGTASNDKAIRGEYIENCKFINCDALCEDGGVGIESCGDSFNWLIENCFAKGGQYGCFLVGDTLIRNSVIVSTGWLTGAGSAYALMGATDNRIILQNSLLIAQPSYRVPTGKGAVLYESDRNLYSVNGCQQVIAENCTFIADGYKPDDAHADSYSDGDSYCIYSTDIFAAINCTFLCRTDQNKNKTAYGLVPDSRLVLENCSIETSGVAATYDLYAASAKIAKLLNCDYDSSKVHANVTVHAIGDSNGGVDVSKLNGSKDSATGLEQATKLLVNKAVQNKSTGAIKYYDDDGQTVILTHTPTDSESEITRMPS